MSALRVHLFGKFNACYGDRPIAGLDTHKVRELFCYLLLYRDRPHPREALASLLWDEDHTNQPIRCLRKALWQLRSALESHAEQLSDRVLLVESDWIQLDPKADLWLDIAMFEQSFARVQGIRGRELEAIHVDTLRTAVELFHGGLRESWYHDWYLYERERLQHMFLIMLDKLMDYCEANGKFETGLAYGTLVLRCERARERTYRRLMRLHCLAGDRTAALRQYERCVAALDQELGVRPAGRTTALYEQIRSDQLNVSSWTPAEGHQAPDIASAPLPEVVGHLKQLRTALSDAQRQLDSIFERWVWS